MSTFQVIIVILLTIYVVFELYFAISGRIMFKKQKEIENSIAQQNLSFEDQIRVLTTRIGEVSTENTRLNGVVREWMEYNNSLKIENDKLKKAEELTTVQLEEYKTKYEEVQKQLKKLSTKKGNS